MAESQELQMKLISLSVRLSKADRATLETKADNLGCSKSEYVRRIITEREVKQWVVPAINREANQLLLQLKNELVKQGVNLNQLIKVAHSYEGITPKLAQQLTELVAANKKLQADIGDCKTHILGQGKTDDR